MLKINKEAHTFAEKNIHSDRTKMVNHSQKGAQYKKTARVKPGGRCAPVSINFNSNIEFIPQSWNVKIRIKFESFCCASARNRFICCKYCWLLLDVFVIMKMQTKFQTKREKTLDCFTDFFHPTLKLVRYCSY